MTARPILFRAEMVRALLAGTKTQTRRVVNGVRNDNCIRIGPRTTTHVLDAAPHCPYGQPGDLLWVREAWRVGRGYDEVAGSTFTSPRVWYPAGGNPVPDWAGRYRHARFMPRWASRLTLRITEVRVERVQDISREDVLAEGLPQWPFEDSVAFGFDGGAPHGYATHTGAFRALWDRMRAGTEHAWDKNPWVWVVGFEVIRANDLRLLAVDDVAS